MSLSLFRQATGRIALALTAALFISACATSQDVATRSNGINDPYESTNRSIHAFNKGLDRNLVRPVAKGYGAVVPVEMRDLVNNFSENLSTPGYVVNSLLQGDFRSAGVSLTRFLMNTTIGIGGLVDAAGELNIPSRETDFGETLAVWGSGEGAYIELPVFGPSTQRDAVGLVVDFFTNPLTIYTIDDDPERYVPPTALAASVLNDREKFSRQIDSVLYESEDSYAQARQIYLQNRRFELGDDQADAADPYEDIYGE
ncbi:VacJ family lipoprotein [uncultured Roseobacter sp.]|uniref:MlaA family lipoprotein n=1 Tax=uncultured Roseobacter sp. TaxID=114847 RepID=UPI002621ED8B|nr:VacJ family lipoprotein [uncultured Roseobacter sp.]